MEEIVNQLSAETNGIICGKVAAYSGHIVSYKTSGLSGLRAALDVEKHVDIQTTLGKQGEEYQKFEFYLHTPLSKQYKFRICYLVLVIIQRKLFLNKVLRMIYILK